MMFKYYRSVLALAVSAALILWLGQSTDIDLRLADLAFDRRQGIFPLQHAWFAEKFNHVILKAMLSVLAGGAVVVALWDAWRPNLLWPPSRRLGVRVVSMSALSVPAVIGLLKRASSSHCPWDLERYGGSAPYIRLLELMPAGIDPGHCLPGGHASSALWLIAVSAFWWPERPRRALGAGALMMVFALGVGFVQQLRGAHFLTHTLWSAWVACAVVMANYSLAKHQAFGYSSVPRNAALFKQ
ncbi:phosphatase PAP2 family protein [Pseudoduganella sp. HUAS MS19]